MEYVCVPQHPHSPSLPPKKGGEILFTWNIMHVAFALKEKIVQVVQATKTLK
jgi:hypothetical protein